NNHECEVSEPPVARQYSFRPNGAARELMGDAELVVKVSKRALEDDERGVAISSKGVWLETTLAGSENREMAQYIFGSIDVPHLDDDNSPVSPFDASRSMQLNPANELVRTILGFLQDKIEEVRRQLVEDERQRRATEDAKKLAAHA